MQVWQQSNYVKENTEYESDHEQVEKISFPFPIYTVHLMFSLI